MCAAFEIGVSTFGEAMRVLGDDSCPELTLNYNLNEIDSAQLFEALKDNTTLTSLEVNDSCSVLGKCTSFEVVVNSLKTNTTLKRLLLRWPKLFPAFADGMELRVADDIGLRLTKAVVLNSSLIDLCLCAFNLTDRSGVPFAEALTINRALKKLRIYEGLQLKDTFGMSLADALSKNQTLTDVTLLDCDFGDMPGKAFADALKINSSLTRFSLSECGVETACAMADAVEVNVKLKVLELECQIVNFEIAAPRFEKAMKTNFTLSKLTVRKWECGNPRGGFAMPTPAGLTRNHHVDTIELHLKLLCRKSQSFQAICDCLPSFPSMIFENFISPTAALHAQARLRSLAAVTAGGELQGFGDNERVGCNIPSDMGGLDVSEVDPLAPIVHDVRDLGTSQKSTPGPDVGAAEASLPPAAAEAEEDLDEGKIEAINVSVLEADEEDNAALMRGIQLNKLDAPMSGFPLSADGVVVLRLTRMANSPHLLELLESAQALERCRQRISEAGCSIQPPWAGGAKLLVPLTAEHFAEAGIELSYDHIVMLASDADQVKAALRELNCKGKTRPKLAAAEMSPHSKRACRQDDRPSSVSTPFVTGYGPAVVISDETADLDTSDDDPVDVEMVSVFALRTDSSLGFPVNPYQGYA